MEPWGETLPLSCVDNRHLLLPHGALFNPAIAPGFAAIGFSKRHVTDADLSGGGDFEIVFDGEDGA